MKKVIFTENQLKRIIGEDFTSYLPNEFDAKDVPDNSYGTEITTSDKLENGEMGDMPTTDKIRRMKSTQGPFTGYFGRTYGRIYEDNQDLVNNRFGINSTIRQDIENSANEEEKKKFLKPCGYKATYKRIYDLKNKAKETPEEFTDIDRRVLKDYENQLETQKNISKRQKETKANIGMTNVYQKAGGTKTSNNGKAHTKKVQDGTITYY